MYNYKKLEKNLLDLLFSLQATIPKGIYIEAREYIEDHGEYGIALELLCDVLCEENISIKPSVLERIKSISDTMKLDSDIWKHISTS